MAARRDQPDYLRTPQGTQPPALTHHHSMSNPIGASIPQPPHSIAPHPASGRPGLDRAHTFPTPPQSASSLTMGMGNSGSSYEYGGGHGGPINSGQPFPLDTGFIPRTLPTSPATSPPSHSQAMQYASSQAYDSSRPMYSASAPYPSQYGSQPSMNRYGSVQTSPTSGVKNEMGPPARAGAENDHADSKPHDGYGSHQDADGEHEGEYTHTSASYGASKPSYSYNPNPSSGPIHSDPAHISPEMTHSPHQNGSGRATPRTTNTYTGYSTPQRASTLPQSNLNYVMSNDTRAGAQQNGAESYPAPGGYQSNQYPSMNGAPPSNKRMREDDEQMDPYGRPLSAGGDPSLKRQRTDPGAVRPISQPQSLKAGGGMRR
jgi:enhanced filamentous growth protein 1